MQDAAFERAVQQGLISVARSSVLTGPAVPTADRPTSPTRFGRSGARAAAKAAAVGGAFRSNVPGIDDATARANTLQGRIRSAMPFRATAADVERVTREQTELFASEYPQ
jgi:hypothetical protein